MLKNLAVTDPSGRKGVFQGLRAFLKELLVDVASAWDCTPQKIVVMWSLPFIISLSAIVAGLISKDLYRWIIQEDSLAENCAVVFYGLAFIGSLAVTWRLFRGKQRLLTFLFIGLSLALLFMVGEEISWGQRIFGWQTPESLNAINQQSETTFHNIIGVQDAFKWLQMLVGAYGTLLPLLVLWIHPPGRMRVIAERIVPHYSLIPFYCFIFFWKIFREIYPNPKYFEWAIAEYNEIMELILSIGFFLFVFYQLRLFRLKIQNPTNSGQA